MYTEAQTGRGRLDTHFSYLNLILKSFVEDENDILLEEDILEDIYFVNATTGWAVGENGVIFATTDGETWKALSSGSEEKLRSVRFIDTETGWAVGGDMGVNVILHTTDGGQNWADQSSGKLFAYDIFSLDDNHIWLTGQNAIIMKYAK